MLRQMINTVHSLQTGRAVRKRSAALAGITAVLLLAGCSSGTGLRPSEPGQLHPEREGAARIQSHDVSLVAEFDEWEGDPDPTDEFTAVLVEIENGSDWPLRIRYDDFRLEAGDRSLAPRDPRKIEGSQIASRSHIGGVRYLDRLSYSGFHLAPHHSSFGRFHGGHGGSHLGSGFGRRFGHGLHGLGLGLHGFGHGFGHRFGHGFGGYPYYSNFVRVELPTRDMLATAVPEGTLEPGGHLKGFLFFPHLEGEVPTATLTAAFRTEDGDPIGEVQLRFQNPETVDRSRRPGHEG